MKVAKYSSVEEVRRIQARLQAVRCGGLTLAVVGLQLDPDCAEIGPLAVDTRFQVIIATKSLLPTKDCNGQSEKA